MNFKGCIYIAAEINKFSGYQTKYQKKKKKKLKA